MRNAGLWFFVLALPILAVLGQDIYMAYDNPHGFDLTKPFPFSDAGWIWQRRAFDSWKWMHDAVDPAFWQKYVRPVLNQKGVVVAAVPLVVFCLVIFVFKLLGLGPFAGNGLLVRRIRLGSGNSKYAIDEAGTRKKMSYKRR